jgi:hypothetical protein
MVFAAALIASDRNGSALPNTINDANAIGHRVYKRA